MNNFVFLSENYKFVYYSNFTVVPHHVYGNCFTLMTGDRKISKAGPSNGKLLICLVFATYEYNLKNPEFIYHVQPLKLKP